MFSKVIVPSLLLAALANGLVFKRDDGYSSTLASGSVPTVTPQLISLPDPSVSLSLPPLDSSPTGTSNSLPGPSFSLSLPPLDPSTTGTPTSTLLSSSSLPSVVTTTVYVYPSDCSPAPSGSPLPTPGPSGDANSLSQDIPLTLPTLATPTPLSLPTSQESPLTLPLVRRDDAVVSQLRAMQQEVVNTWVNLGKGDQMMGVVGQLESIIAQAVAPGANGAALLKQAQALVQK